MNRSPAFLEKSAELAHELGQDIRREGRYFVVPSRTTPGVTYAVAWALDGSLICNCVAAWAGKYECWHVKAVREEIRMTTTEERMLPAVRLMPSESLLPSEHTYKMIDRAAQLALSGAVALPKELNTADKVAAVMLYGWELGLKPMTALQHLFIVYGRVQPSAQVMAGLLEARTDARIRVVESTDRLCTLRLVWPSRRIDETWSCDWAEVQRAGLDKDPSSAWAKYPRDKLIWHTTKRLLRVYAPDVINGLVGPVVTDEALEAEDDELYNDGDGPEAYVDGQVVDTETGEIICPHDEIRILTDVDYDHLPKDTLYGWMCKACHTLFTADTVSPDKDPTRAKPEETGTGLRRGATRSGLTRPAEPSATPPTHEASEQEIPAQVTPAPASPHKRIRVLLNDRMQTSDRRSFEAFLAHLMLDFPYAVKEHKFQVDELTDEDAAALLLVLEPAIP